MLYAECSIGARHALLNGGSHLLRIDCGPGHARKNCGLLALESAGGDHYICAPIIHGTNSSSPNPSASLLLD